MSEHKSDELFLRGRVQLEVARDALAYTGINPEAENRLQVFLDAHERLSDGVTQNDTSIYLQGEVIAKEKADILHSLEVVSVSENISAELRLAADALRSIL